MTPSPTPLTFDFHPQPLSVISPYHPSMIQAWCAYSCAIVVLFFAVTAYRKLSAGGCSLSLNDISYGPILLGLLVGYGAGLAVQVVVTTLTVISSVISHPVDAAWPIVFIECVIVTGRVLGYAAAGATVWFAAKENRLGHVILAGIAIVALDVSLFVFSTPFRYLPLIVRLFLAKELLIPAIFIGALLAQKWRGTKVQPA